MTSVSIQVDTADQAGEARRRAARIASALRLDETTAGRLALVVTECANNLWKHGGGGEILLNSPGADGSGVDVLALDRGSGMGDPARCFQDGYSTAGSAGTGLGAVCRLSEECQVYTADGKGTALLARVQKNGGSPPNPAERFEIGGVCVPQRGETLCGDGYIVEQADGGCRVLVADGLGHGPAAADCADAAIGAFREGRETSSPGELLQEVHGALRTTRGAAVAIGFIDTARRELRYAGIGNIGGFLWRNGQARHLLSHPGIVGHDIRMVRELTYELGPDIMLLLYSDGISTHWSLSGYEGLLSRDPSLIAGVVYRDHSRRRDDATVLVVRERSGA
jgi:anti-sigma regulatory factor (Ser/Thr protein kinase)